MGIWRGKGKKGIEWGSRIKKVRSYLLKNKWWIFGEIHQNEK